MAIKIQDIIEKCNFLLDAEDSDRYKFDNDFKPAAKLTQQWLVSLYNKFFGENKISEESLTELVSIKAYWMGSVNRVAFSRDGHKSDGYVINGAVVDNGDGTVKIPTTVPIQGIEAGEYGIIVGTTNYDGYHQIIYISEDKSYFYIPATFVSETLVNDKFYAIHRFWTLIGIYPEITTIPVSPTPPTIGETGIWAKDAMVNQILKSCTRLTLEEWTEMQRNPLVPGSELITNSELKEYAYLSAAHYNPVTYSISQCTGYEVDAGTTTGESSDKLIETGQDFLTTVTINDVVHNTTDDTWAIVTGIDTDIQLSISVDIMKNSENYRILNNAAILSTVYEYLVSHDLDKKLIGVGFLKRPLEETIVHQTNIIPFPESLMELVVDKFLQFISIKEDDRRSLYDISDAEIQKAFTLLS